MENQPELLPDVPNWGAPSWGNAWLHLLKFAVHNGSEVVGELTRCPVPPVEDLQAAAKFLTLSEQVWTDLTAAVQAPLQHDLPALHAALVALLHQLRSCANVHLG